MKRLLLIVLALCAVSAVRPARAAEAAAYRLGPQEEAGIAKFQELAHESHLL